MRRHTPRKRFGQHFLVDDETIGSIVAEINPLPEDHLVEIGPGLGALTTPLLDRVEHLHAIELDRDLAERLRERYPPGRLSVHQTDALRFDFSTLPVPLRVVGNLPYNISTPLLFRFASVASRCADLLFMLQQEVVDRMVAKPSGPEYGRLSIMLQYRFRMQRLFTVPPEAFRPQPKIRSAVVRLVPRPTAELEAQNETEFSRVVAKAFSMRRKTLRNALFGLISEYELRELGIDPGARAEALPVGAYVTIANRVRRSRT